MPQGHLHSLGGLCRYGAVNGGSGREGEGQRGSMRMLGCMHAATLTVAAPKQRMRSAGLVTSMSEGVTSG